jgi:phosphonate transport system substrate-binding protein
LDDVFKNPKNVNFGIGDPNSTSGFLVPTYYIFSERKVEPRAIFKTVRNGSHGANIQAVLAKQLDVATNNTEDMGRLKVTRPDLFEQLRVIWTSPLIPSDPFVWRKDLDPAIKEKLRTFVLGYAKTDAQEKEILKNIYNYGGFRASTNDQLKPIRQLELFKDRQKILSAQGLSQAEKDAKVKEIDQALAKLQ